MKPPTISEEDEEDEEAGTAVAEPGAPETVDKEVAEWVRAAMDRKAGGKMGKAAKPALHAAPLDAVPVSPPIDDLSVPPPAPAPVEAGA